MKKIQIFEPAMCCPTGLCGVGVDQELLRISTVLSALNKKGIEVERFNLTSAPMEFVNNKTINDLLNTKGVDDLPAIVLDGEIVLTGRYPSNDEFCKILDLPSGTLNEKSNPFEVTTKSSSGSCDCSDGGCC
ncbi:arsenical resistance operon trans-acting repressor ArsD [Desulfitobacterium sp. LBE]|uniref:Arsenical resistance operon trans-acting repressor ArsD n=1 Tax=bioreactor metagenome TaxID=1076179 RepID=A0A644W195_9ZZZZ|nr:MULTISPECIES: arsenite efflux transporter metallochaperone ArsD [Desulfitobacterium]MEA5024874.1 arsenite efflux transporter metallochaperone ArsD [Desulfitobacterium hafniense]TWH59599.1 arsenical resistance operon trans-acting repressor ArsD [Desulfitobacterium sp. LBE]